MHCYGNQPRSDNADGDGHAVLIEHYYVAISVGGNWRRRHSNADWHCGASRRRLYLRGDNINGWQRNDQHSRRIAGHGQRSVDGNLYARRIQFLDLQRRYGIKFGDGDHSREDHTNSDSDAVSIEHPGGAGSFGGGRRQRRNWQPDAYRLSNTIWRRLHLPGYNADEWQHNLQHSGRIALDGQRYSDSELHSGLIQFLDLQQLDRIEFADGKRKRDGTYGAGRHGQFDADGDGTVVEQFHTAID